MKAGVLLFSAVIHGLLFFFLSLPVRSVIYTAAEPVKPISLFNLAEYEPSARNITLPAVREEKPPVEETFTETPDEAFNETPAETFMETAEETGEPFVETKTAHETNYTETGNPPPAGSVIREIPENGANEEYIRKNYRCIQRRISDCLMYPSQARRKGISGRSDVIFTINTDGSISDLSIRKTSGSGILDNAALEAVKKAAPFKNPPALARIAIPVVFTLR